MMARSRVVQQNSQIGIGTGFYFSITFYDQKENTEFFSREEVIDERMDEFHAHSLRYSSRVGLRTRHRIDGTDC